MTDSPLTFYTMLYIKDDNLTANNAVNDHLNILGYIKCCKLLSESLQEKGIPLVVLSNKPEIIRIYEPALTTEQASFDLAVPQKIKFYSAHYKIEVFRHLAQKESGYFILVDNDVVCINDIPENLKIILEKQLPVYYDITSQCYPAYGKGKIIADKSAVMGEKSVGNWAGGEFIGGTASFYKALYQQCMAYWPIYVNFYREYHHQGDEMVLSCAIEQYLLSGHPLIDVGSFGGIARHWSIKTKHIARPIEALLDHFLWHLPADKEYLLRYPFRNGEIFKEDYRRDVSGQNGLQYLLRRVNRKLIHLFDMGMK